MALYGDRTPKTTTATTDDLAKKALAKAVSLEDISSNTASTVIYIRQNFR